MSSSSARAGATLIVVEAGVFAIVCASVSVLLLLH
jgi:hypothetical protein